MTPHEVKLWAHLRRLRSQGHHFRRQVPIAGYIVDFACYRSRLVIEVDGGQHASASHSMHDAERDAHLAQMGLRVLRFWNSDIDCNFDGVMATIGDALK